MTKQFNKSAVSLTVPYLDSTPFSLTVRQDVVNAAVATLLPPEELVVLLDYVVSLGMRGLPLLHHGNVLNQGGSRMALSL